MNNASGGNVIYHFKGDYKNLDKSTKEVQGKLNGLGKAGKGALLGVAAATTTATAAVVALARKSVQAYGEYEQLQGGLVSMMKGNQDAVNQVLDTSKKAYKDLQMSQSEYLTAFESSYAIIQNGLSENANAIEYTNKVIQLSADLFNTFGGSTEQYSNAINWALKGTYSYLDNLNIGIKGTQEGFIEAANASGVLGREIQSVKDITNDEIINVIQHYAEKAGAWKKSQQEASTTIIGSINMVKAAYNDFLSGQGGIEQVVSSINAVAQNIAPVIVKILPGIVKGITDLINGLIPLLPGLIKELLPVLIAGTTELIIGIIGILPQLMEMIAELLPDMLPVIVDAILQVIPMLIDMLPLFINAGAKVLIGLMNGIINSAPSLLSAVAKIVVGIIKSINQLPSKLFTAGVNVVRGLLNGIKNKASSVLNYAGDLANRIKEKISNALKIGSPSRATMWQGEMTVEGYMVGLEKMRSQLEDAVYDTFALSPQFTNSSALHYSPSVVVNNNVSLETDPLGQTVSKIKTFAGGAKNDYNYGVGV